MSVRDNLGQEQANHGMVGLNGVCGEQVPSVSTYKKRMAEVNSKHPESMSRETQVAGLLQTSNIAAVDKTESSAEPICSERLSIFFS